ncbi:acyl carrier protein [Alkaliphilus oremlandii]|uniref:Acyl carrier protein n=1 Tax=Alkaliphilus oremlandii (strain OhILAs) TaxID=350688 RepID=A8MIL4_ALKOO|nr:acyl carrier protein [Alkaliphilus oremlandii]ABW19646.1 acyl carrier protein [Alkaliphilus oremlandii OhILAs]
MVLQKIKEIVAEQLGLDDVDAISATTSLTGDLDADSLDAVEIIMAIEDEFGVEIPDEEVENFKNIGDIVEYVQSNK